MSPAVVELVSIRAYEEKEERADHLTQNPGSKKGDIRVTYVAEWHTFCTSRLGFLVLLFDRKLEILRFKVSLTSGFFGI